MTYQEYHQYHARIRTLERELASVEARLAPVHEQYRALNQKRKELRAVIDTLQSIAENKLEEASNQR